MSDLDFIQRASIAAMQSISINKPNFLHSEIAQKAVARAEELLTIIKGKTYSNEEEITNNERIDNLEYAMDNIVLFLEHNCSGWINEPIVQQQSSKDETLPN